jgi:hypothetical protein
VQLLHSLGDGDWSKEFVIHKVKYPVVPRSGFRQQVKPSIDMICIASGCAKRTYKPDFGASLA